MRQKMETRMIQSMKTNFWKHQQQQYPEQHPFSKHSHIREVYMTRNHQAFPNVGNFGIFHHKV